MKTQFLATSFALLLSLIGYGRAIPLEQEIKSLEKEIKASPNNLNKVLRLAECYNLHSRYYQSLNLLQEYEKKHGHLSENQHAEIHLSLAKSYKFLDDNGQANLNFLKASDKFIKARNYNGFLKCGIEQIEFNRRTRRFDLGEKQFYYYSHFAKKYQLKNPEIWIGLYNRYAAILNETGRRQASLTFSKKAIEIAKTIDDKNAQAISFNEIGFAYAHLDKCDSAKTAYSKAAQLYYEVGYLREFVHVSYNLEMLAIQEDSLAYDKHIASLWKLANFIEAENIDYYKTEIYHGLRTLYYKKRDYKGAYHADLLYEKNLTKEINRVQQTKIEEVTAQYKNKELSKENKNILLREQTKNKELKSAKVQILLIVLVLIITLVAIVGLYLLLRKLRRTNNLLVKRNEQKTLLVQEIHHRVKNNLQFVRSMLDLQSTTADSNEEVENLNDVSRRIDAMSLVHEMLYTEEEGMIVSLNEYIEKLVKHSFDLFTLKRNVNFKLDIDEIEIPIDKIVSIGIICSELITNTIKHSFTNDEDPEISIKITSLNEKEIELYVCDNGTEQIIQDQKRYSLGMRIIDIFARQLNGIYAIDKANGYSFTMKFKAK